MSEELFVRDEMVPGRVYYGREPLRAATSADVLAWLTEREAVEKMARHQHRRRNIIAWEATRSDAQQSFLTEAESDLAAACGVNDG